MILLPGLELVPEGMVGAEPTGLWTKVKEACSFSCSCYQWPIYHLARVVLHGASPISTLDNGTY
jgi:hypothetical protein